MDPTTIRQVKINRFDEHVEIPEEQYIDNEIDAPEMLLKESSSSRNRSPRTEEMHQVQSIDTVDHITVNRQRQVSRTGTAQWQHPGDVSCEATHVPMIQKLQKTVGILQVPHIDKVKEIPQAQLIDEAVELHEIMQRHGTMIQKVEDAQKTSLTKPKRS